MAAFTSSLQHHFLIDSFLNSNTSFTQFCHPLEMETDLDDHSTNASAVSYNDPCPVLNMTSMDSSSNVTADYNVSNNSSEQVSAQKVTKPVKVVNNTKKRKSKNGASSAQSKDMGEVKEKKQKKVMNKDDGEVSKCSEGKKKKGQKKANEDEPPVGYIHVRARRGQATDSHSLAERVRRERISERMKLLQSLVPGCDKVTGKALMLDEIINYVQSLQHQVEFLSSKLASFNPMPYDFGMDLESSFMVTPNQNLNSLPSVPQQCSPTAVNNNILLDNISANAVLFQQVQLPNTLSQGNRQLLWEVDEQRQKIINQSGFSNNNNLFSFN